MSSRRSFRGVPCPGAFLWSMPTAHGVISNSGLFCLTVSVARPAPQSHLRSKPVRAPVRSTRVALIDMRVPVPCSRWSSRCVTGPQSNRDWRSGRAANCRKRWIGTELGRLMMVMHRGSRAPIRTMHGGGALRPIHFSFNAKQTTRPSV
jgi:hypothetical protein